MSNNKIQIGLSTYSFPWAIGIPQLPPPLPMSLLDLIEQTAALEVNGLQLADNLPLHKLSEQDRRIAYRRATELGIQLEVGARGMQLDHALRYLDLAVEARSPFLRFVIDGPGFEPGIPEIIQIIEQLLPSLQEQNLILAIENHDRFKVEELVAIMEETDPEWVGICLDAANSLGAGEGIKEVFTALAPYTVNFHIKDFQIKRLYHNMGFRVTGSPAGEGIIPIPDLLQQLQTIGKCRSATLETWMEPLTTIEETILQEREWVTQGIRYLKTFI